MRLGACGRHALDTKKGIRLMDLESLYGRLGVTPGGCLFADKRGREKPMPTPLAPLADSHGHLTSRGVEDPAAVLARAALVGVRLMVCPVDTVKEIPGKWGSVGEFLDWFEVQKAQAAGLLDVAAEHGLVPPAFDGYDAPGLLDSVYLFAGAHPYGAAGFDDAAEAVTRELLASPSCLGVGEIGLDYGPYNEVDPAVQEVAFRRQLRLAHELGLPVELHIRDANDDPAAQAHADAVRILEEEGVPAAGCDLHCFTSGPEVMVPFVELGCHIAFGGAATFKRSDDIRAAAVECPAEKLLLETDFPYMAPEPLRGRPCEPAMCGFTAALLAQAHEEAGMAAAATYEALWTNTRAFFGV